LSVVEGVDSLLSFKKHTEWPLIIRLVVHLPRQHNVNFNKNEYLAIVAERATRQRTTLTAYFAYNAQNVDGRKWCTWTSLLIMFGKFEKNFGKLDNEEKKLLGEYISYIPPLVNASSFASYLLSYRARLLSNISGLLTTQSIQRFKLLAEHWDYCKTTHNGTCACGKHVSIKMQRG
jgi:hypothetical protein